MNIEYKKKYLKYKNKYMRLNGGIGVLRGGGELEFASFIIHEDNGEKYFMPTNFNEDAKLFSKHLTKYILDNRLPQRGSSVPAVYRVWISNKYGRKAPIDNEKTLNNYLLAMEKWKTNNDDLIKEARSLSGEERKRKEEEAQNTPLSIEEQLPIIFNFTQAVAKEDEAQKKSQGLSNKSSLKILLNVNQEEIDTLVNICKNINSNLNTHNTANEADEDKHEVYIKYDGNKNSRPWYIFLTKPYKYIELSDVTFSNASLLIVQNPKSS